MNKNLLIGLGAVVIVAIAVWGFMATKTPNSAETPPTPTPTGTPAPSPTPTPAPQAGAPVVETTAKAAPYITTAVLTGTVNPSGDQTSYWYEYGLTNSLGTKSAIQGIGSGFGVISAPTYVTGLRANTQYFYRLSAQNSFGTTNGSIQTVTTSNTPPPVGRAPTASTDAAGAIERTAASLHGRVNPNGVETVYWFEYGDKVSLGTTKGVQSVGGGTTEKALTLSVSDLKPLTKYYFRINAQNSFGTVNGTVLNFTTTGPRVQVPVITISAATTVGSTTATVNGKVNPNGAASTYWFEYSTDSQLKTSVQSTVIQPIVAGTVATNVRADLIGLSANTKYYYRLSGKSLDGSVTSSIQSFTTKK